MSKEKTRTLKRRAVRHATRTSGSFRQNAGPGGARQVSATLDDKPWFMEPCCENESRNMNGGCDNCGDPCL